MNQADAEDLISSTEMLLKFVYEFPARVRPVACEAADVKRLIEHG